MYFVCYIGGIVIADRRLARSKHDHDYQDSLINELNGVVAQNGTNHVSQISAQLVEVYLIDRRILHKVRANVQLLVW